MARLNVKSNKTANKLARQLGIPLLGKSKFGRGYIYMYDVAFVDALTQAQVDKVKRINAARSSQTGTANLIPGGKYQENLKDSIKGIHAKLDMILDALTLPKGNGRTQTVDEVLNEMELELYPTHA